MTATLTKPASAPSAAGFDRFGLGRSIQRGVAAAGFETPRPIQERTIPAALAGRDVLGLAQTGTGKTAAFALPILERLISEKKRGPRALILAPTRELATQISDEIARLAKFTRLRCLTIFGGVSERPQIAGLRRHPDIVVACPGRLLDLIRQGHAKLGRIETLVLDEADHMFDMGFLPDIRRILAALPDQRQNLLYSATMPREIRTLADKILSRPEVIDLTRSVPELTIEHSLYPVADRQKLPLLKRFLAEDDFVSAIVFTRTKHRAKKIALQLAKHGHRAVALQGNMSQNARDKAMDGFRQRKFEILVATDIVARGIDVAQVSHVINFDAPRTADAYTHRIGRTGRSERDGKAYTLVTDDDAKLIRDVERRLGRPIPRRVVDGLKPEPAQNDSKRRAPAPKQAAPKPAGRNTRSRRPRRSPRSR